MVCSGCGSLAGRPDCSGHFPAAASLAELGEAGKRACNRGLYLRRGKGCHRLDAVRIFPSAIVVVWIVWMAALPDLWAMGETSPGEQAAADLVRRATPSLAGQVSFRLGGDDAITVSAAPDGRGVLITAPDTARMVYGYGQYLKRAGGHLSWNGNRLPAVLPLPEEKVDIAPSPWPIRFAYNYCALSYTAGFRGWSEWERELDFLALQGMTHVLVTAGLEKVWKLFLEKLGAAPGQIGAFIAHPAYAAWWHMGNIEGMGGPLSSGRIEREAKLGRQITARLRELGMTPVLQGYVGFLPHDLSPKKKDFRVLPQGRWCYGTRPSVLDPCSGGFARTAGLWYDCLARVYGFRARYFAGDLFHEGGNKAGIDEKAAVCAVQAAMQKASPGAVWVLQSWHGNPSDAFLEALDPKRSLILRLVKDLNAGDAGWRDFRGIPWLWCELANFGGKSGLYGGLPLMCRLGGSLAAGRNRGLQGLGLNSEGTETNPLYYDFFFSRLASDAEWDLVRELDALASRRYGSAAPELREGLRLLADSVYTPDKEREGGLESILCGRPAWDMAKASTWSSGRRYYDVSAAFKAVRLFLAAAARDPLLAENEGFRYDVLDFARQAVADSFFNRLQEIRTAFQAKDLAGYDQGTAAFLALADDLDAMLGSHRQFRLGSWTEQARAREKGKEAKEHEAFLAKMLVTTWCGEIQALNDYSNRQWSGLIRDFYIPRWKCFFAWQRKTIAENMNPRDAAKGFLKECGELELAFARNGKKYSGKAVGSPLSAVKGLMAGHGSELARLLGRDAGGGGYSWSVSAGDDAFRVDVTDSFMQAGVFRIVWECADLPSFRRVTLYRGDVSVAAAEKISETAWRIRLPQLSDALEAYTLRVELDAPAAAGIRGRLQVIPE